MILRAVYIFFMGLIANALFIGVKGAEDCEVTIDNGKIIGVTTESENADRKICEYRSIPYAMPPVGNLRFKSPLPPKPWATPLNATKSPNWCPQAAIPPPGTTMSEDCLFLNVYQPKIENVANSSLPVMVWFHGGSFTGGSSDEYQPSKLLTRGDIILVVVHYRLGLLGFLSTGDSAAPGNWGLKDQSFSIQWVNENIKRFGGGRVTIFGQSAGGVSAVFQMLSPLNTGKISGVIAQSGTTAATWAMDTDPKASSKVIANRLLCPTLTSQTIVNCMRLLPWQALVLAQSLYTLHKITNFEYAYAGLTPVVEPVGTEGALITEDPIKMMESGKVPQIPLMLGTTKHDGSFVLATLYQAKIGKEKLDKNPDYMKNDLVPDFIKFFRNEEDVANRAVSSSAEMFYLDGVNRESFVESMPGLVDLFTVFAYKSSIHHTAELLSKRNVPVYLYSFEHHSNNTVLWDRMFDEKVPIKSGIAHADDLMYLFDLNMTFSQNDQLFSEMFIDMWINFAKTGNPTPSQDARYEQWPTYNSKDEQFMKLNSTPTVLTNYRSSWRPNGFEWS